ncbi:MAG: DUF4468 domain-containing protein [Bacteroidetes bacterium]|nr:DUF4468 domain-containing protein [Bacteroidota bacterium]
MRRISLVITVLLCTSTLGFALEVHGSGHAAGFAPSDTIRLHVEGTKAYYQQVVKVDSSIKLSSIYTRTLEFMAAKNFQQNYGYEQEGKLIFTTTQDLNENANFTDNDNDNPEPYTVQFSITVDMKNGRYRYTITNVVFYLPTDNGNRKLSLYEVYQKEGDDQPRRISKDAKKLIDSFERYLGTLTQELYDEIEHKAAIYNSKF